MVVRTATGSFMGVSMKHLSLATLTFQNSALILVMHYSRVMPLVGGQRYHTSTSVLLNEMIKLGISMAVALYELSNSFPSNTSALTLVRTLVSATFAGDSWKLAIPALLYTIQNTLQYVAVSNLDAATFQVTYQLKILTTAIFSVLMLGRVLSARKWLSLVLLIVGVSIIQVPQALHPVEEKKSGWTRTLEKFHALGHQAAAHLSHRSASSAALHEIRATPGSGMNSQVGLTAVLVACALSGLAGVTFEKILKDSPTAKSTSLWIRNCQLSFWSLFPALFLGVLWKDGEVIAKTGFFAGYNWVVWTAIMFQAAGGIIVALVINYADNIAKNFATSISILISCVASVYFFDFKVTLSFFLGTCVVLFATYLYTKPEPVPTEAPMQNADFEKGTPERSASFEYDVLQNGSTQSPRRSGLTNRSRPGTPTNEQRFSKRES
ncbi:UDP-galactose transporter Gms1 [Coniothyrium glycines]